MKPFCFGISHSNQFGGCTMHIVNRNQFMKLPSGTVYCKFYDSSFGEVQVKGPNAGEDIDWFYYDLFSLDTKDSGSFFDLLNALEADPNAITQTADFPILTRDGLFEDEEKFAIFSEEDVSRLMKALTSWRQYDFG